MKDCLLIHKSVLPESFLLVYKTKEIIEEKKISVSEACKETGISRSNLYAIFSGEQQPQLSTALKIIKELGYTVQVA